MDYKKYRYGLDNEIWFGRGQIEKFNEEACQITLDLDVMAVWQNLGHYRLRAHSPLVAVLSGRHFAWGQALAGTAEIEG